MQYEFKQGMSEAQFKDKMNDIIEDIGKIFAGIARRKKIVIEVKELK